MLNKNSRVLITGGSRGIGLALAQKFHKKGLQVHSVSRVISKNFGTNHFQHQCDLSSIKQSIEFIKKFIDEFGVPDILINNAGSGAFYEWNQFPPEEIESQINLLFTVPLLFCREIAPLMQNENKGVIVNISSLATLYPLPYMPVYNASKSAISSFTQTLMIEFSDFPRFIDMRVGDVRTDFNNSSAKQPKANWTSKMKKAWNQIEKQLHESPSSSQIAQIVEKVILLNKSGVFYAGSFLHAKIAPFFAKFLSDRMTRILLRNRYFK